MKPSRRTRRLLLIIGPVLLLAGVLGWGSLPRGPLIITPPPADAEPGRWVHLEGAANTRDVGGYPAQDGYVVKRGNLYRSASLSRLSTNGVDAYRKLGVKTVIDFRNRLSALPLFNGDVWGVQLVSSVHGCPMSFKHSGPRREFYIRGVRDDAASARQAFELLAHPDNFPVLWHCTHGTDRTGVMTALLLALLGVERETIIADFRLSEQVHLPGNLEAMQNLLDDVAASGGIEAYLTQMGVSSDTQQHIRATLLEPR